MSIWTRSRSSEGGVLSWREVRDGGLVSTSQAVAGTLAELDRIGLVHRDPPHFGRNVEVGLGFRQIERLRVWPPIGRVVDVPLRGGEAEAHDRPAADLRRKPLRMDHRAAVGDAEIIEDLHDLAGEAALRKLGCALHEQDHIVLFDVGADPLLDAICVGHGMCLSLVRPGAPQASFGADVCKARA